MSQLSFYPYPVAVHNTKPHAHFEPELACVWKGKLEVTLSGEKHIISEGGMFYVNSLETHEYRAVDCEYAYCSFVAFNLRILKKTFPEIGDFRYAMVVPDYSLTSREINLLRIMLLAMYRNSCDPFNKANGNMLICQSIGFVVLNLLQEQFIHTDKSASAYEDTDRSKSIMEYILKNYQNDISLTSISSYLHLSPSYGSHYFKDTFHMGFRQYLTLIRVINARQMLQDEKIPITAVALDCGFGDNATFSKVFKKNTGLSPSEFRKTSYVNAPQYSERRMDDPIQSMNFELYAGVYQTKSGHYCTISYEESLELIHDGYNRMSLTAPELISIYHFYTVPR